MHASTAPPDPAGLGPLLLHARRAHGRSQQHLAEQLCAIAGVATVSRHEISRWEREERIPSRYWLAWLSVVLGVDEVQLARATARTRSRRASAGEPAMVSAWPWRVLAGGRVRDAHGHVAALAARVTLPPATITPES